MKKNIKNLLILSSSTCMLNLAFGQIPVARPGESDTDFAFEGLPFKNAKFKNGRFEYSDPNPSSIYQINQIVSFRASPLPHIYPWYYTGFFWKNESDKDVQNLNNVGKVNGVLKGAPYKNGTVFKQPSVLCGSGFDHTSPLNVLTKECINPEPTLANDATPDFPRFEGDEGYSVVYNGNITLAEGDVNCKIDGERVRYSLGLNFFLNVMKQNRLYGTDIYTQDLSQADQVSDLIPQLVVNENQRGYQLIREEEITAGASLMTSLVFKNLPVTIGLAPFKGYQLHTSQTAPNRKAADDLPRLKIPYKASDVDQWKAGDALSYTSRGGIIFTAGAGLGNVFSLGATYTAEGEWGVTVRKLDKNVVLVDISTGKVKTLGVSLSGSVGLLTFTPLSIQKFDGINEGFSFLMSLTNDDTKKAYEELLRGNIVSAQKMVVDNKITTVLPLSDTQTKKVGRSVSSYIGLPFIFTLRSSNSKIYTANYVDYHPNNQRTNIHYGTYAENSNFLIFNNVESKDAIFNANVYETFSDNNIKLEEGHASEIYWLFNENKMTRREIYQTIRDLTKKTGFKDEISINIKGKYTEAQGNAIEEREDVNPYWTENFGSTTISLSARITRLGGDYLMKLANDSAKYKDFEKISRGFVASYFNDEMFRTDPNGVCKVDEWKGPNRGDVCAYRVDTETKKASAELIKHLRDMSIYLKNGNKKEFVASYAEFGRVMMSNQFIFQTVFHLIKNRNGLDLEFVVTGEKLPFMKKHIDWLPKYTVSN